MVFDNYDKNFIFLWDNKFVETQTPHGKQSHIFVHLFPVLSVCTHTNCLVNVKLFFFFICPTLLVRLLKSKDDSSPIQPPRPVWQTLKGAFVPFVQGYPVFKGLYEIMKLFQFICILESMNYAVSFFCHTFIWYIIEYFSLAYIILIQG